jgi:hypothetical protein
MYPPYKTLVAALGQNGREEEARAVIAEALQWVGKEFPALCVTRNGEDRIEDHEHLCDGLSKAGLQR